MSATVLAWIRRQMARRTTTPLAVICADGVWVDGERLTLEAYTARYSDKARQEITATLALEDL